MDHLIQALTNSLSALHQQVKDPYTATSHRAAKTFLAQSRLGQHLYNLANPKLPPES